MLQGVDYTVLAEKIMRERPYVALQAAYVWAKQIVEDTDERLRDNVMEWLYGLPLSPIVCRGSSGIQYSIETILEQYRAHDFLSALECMNMLLAGTPGAEARIRRIYR